MADEKINGTQPSQSTGQSFPDIQKAYTATQPINTEWTNHSAFYAVYPSYYYPFAQNWLRRWLEWFDGYVPGIHDNSSGIISTRLATTLCYRLAQQVFGGGLLYSGSKKTKDVKASLTFVSDEDFNETFANEILKAFILSAAGGTSYAKINVDSKGKGWIDTWRADSAYADFDFKGDVIKARFLGAHYTKTVPGNASEQDKHFYVVEDRFIAMDSDVKEYAKKYADKIPDKYPVKLVCDKAYTIYRVYRLTGTVNNFEQGVNLGRELNWEELPDDIKKSIRETYGAIVVNKPILLPFIDGDLGVQAFKWTSFISNLPQLPFGESLLSKIQAYLFEYDFKNSCMNTDMYLGRGRVLVPKSLQSPTTKGASGVYNTGLDNFLFTKVEYASTEDKQPTPIQFDLRSAEWLGLRNILVENIATSIEVSPSTIASYLNDNSARTAREISSEESATALFVETKRKLFKKPINRLLKTILLLNGYTDCISVKFSASGQTNLSLVVDNTTREYQAGLRSEYAAVKKLNPDMSEEELQKEIERIHADKEYQAKTQGSVFGDGFEDGGGQFGNDVKKTNLQPDAEEDVQKEVEEKPKKTGYQDYSKEKVRNSHGRI